MYMYIENIIVLNKRSLRALHETELVQKKSKELYINHGHIYMSKELNRGVASRH